MVKIRNQAHDAWNRLQDAIERHDPACLGDDRFILDRHDLKTGVRDELEAICWSCPIRGACTAYASADDPPAAYWPTLAERKDAA